MAIASSAAANRASMECFVRALDTLARERDLE
jgi:hypothetical protein